MLDVRTCRAQNSDQGKKGISDNPIILMKSELAEVVLAEGNLLSLALNWLNKQICPLCLSGFHTGCVCCGLNLSLFVPAASTVLDWFQTLSNPGTLVFIFLHHKCACRT